MNDDEIISQGWHWTYGWMRLPHLDKQYNGYAYEDPDGNIVICSERRFRKALYLEARMDGETGEIYHCISHLPRVYKGKTHALESARDRKSLRDKGNF